MPKFSTRYLLLGIVLFALGSCALYAENMLPPYTDVDMPTPAMLATAFSGFILIGAGIFAPFKHPWIGACAGVVIPVLIIIASVILGRPI